MCEIRYKLGIVLISTPTVECLLHAVCQTQISTGNPIIFVATTLVVTHAPLLLPIDVASAQREVAVPQQQQLTTSCHLSLEDEISSKATSTPRRRADENQESRMEKQRRAKTCLTEELRLTNS
jgi:hypothetical protein